MLLRSPFFASRLLYGSCWRQCTFANSDSAYLRSVPEAEDRAELDDGERVEHGRVATIYGAEGERNCAV
jgi:hypothetical protein